MSTMKSAQTVYYGPSTSTYPSMGSVSSGESVTALWNEGTWTYIKYSVSGTSNYKCGYVSTSTVTITETISTKTLSSSTRYVNTASTVYLGPSSSGYASGGSVSLGETVSCLGYKSNSYAYIEYSISGSSQKKRAYIYDSYLSTSQPTSKIMKDPITPSALFLEIAILTMRFQPEQTYMQCVIELFNLHIGMAKLVQSHPMLMSA